MKIFLTVLAVNLVGSVAAMADTQKCLLESRNSCWTLENSGVEGVTVSCKDDRSYLDGDLWNVPAAGALVRQFDSGWGDGLGFPEPGVNVQCEVSRGAHKAKAQLSFTTIGWGDAVSIDFTSDEVVVSQQDGWEPLRVLEQRFPWSSSRR